jgi:hypothetical protein
MKRTRTAKHTFSTGISIEAVLGWNGSEFTYTTKWSSKPCKRTIEEYKDWSKTVAADFSQAISTPERKIVLEMD